MVTINKAYLYLFTKKGKHYIYFVNKQLVIEFNSNLQYTGYYCIFGNDTDLSNKRVTTKITKLISLGILEVED